MPDLKKSLMIILSLMIMGFVVNIVFGILNLGVVSNILSAIAIFLVFHYLLKKYYQVSWKKSLGIYVAFSVAMIILSLLIVVPVRQYVIQPIFVNGNSMSPNYKENDYLLVGIFDKQFSRGDVVVYKIQNQFLIKRIIGLPGEKVEINNSQILINGQVLNEPYINTETLGKISLTLESDSYFVLGDNRGASLDSRIHGPIKNTDIVGKVLYNFTALNRETN